MAHYYSNVVTTNKGISWQLHMFTASSGTNNSTLDVSIWVTTSKNGSDWWSEDGTTDGSNLFSFVAPNVSVSGTVHIRTQAGNRKPYNVTAAAGSFSVSTYALLKDYKYINTGYEVNEITISTSLNLKESGTAEMVISEKISVNPVNPLPKPNQPDLSYTTYNIATKSLNNSKWPDSNYLNQTNTLRLYNIAPSYSMDKYKDGKYKYSVFEIKFNKNSNLSYIAYYEPGPISTSSVIYGCIPYYTNTNYIQVSNFAVTTDKVFKVGAFTTHGTSIINDTYKYVKRIPKVELKLSEKKIIISDVLSDNKTTGADGYGLLPFKNSSILPSIIPTNENYNYPYTGYVIQGTSYLPASCYRIACNSSSNVVSSFYDFKQFNDSGYIVEARTLNYKVEDTTDSKIKLYNTEARNYTYIKVKPSNNTEKFADESDLIIDEDAKVHPVGIDGTSETTVVPSKCYIEFSDSTANYINSIYYKTNLQAELPVYYPELSGTSNELTVTWKKGNTAVSTPVSVSPKNVMTSLTDNGNNIGKVSVCIFNKNEEEYVFNDSESIGVYRKNNLVPCIALTYSEYISMTKTQ